MLPADRHGKSSYPMTRTAKDTLALIEGERAKVRGVLHMAAQCVAVHNPVIAA